MIVPSIDIQNGSTVQLVGGQKLELDAGDPRGWARKFSPLGPVAVIDLDAATGRGSNAELIRQLLPLARCRVGGGIRDVATAIQWLDWGAESVIIGTAARPELLCQIPAERLIVALDSIDDEIVVEGWQARTGRKTLDRIHELKSLVGGFLVTFVEREGRLGGTRMDMARKIIDAAGDVRVTVAGGITTAEEIAQLDRWGADSQVGMALYQNRISLAEAFAAPLVSDREDGLWPTVVVDEEGRALGLAYSSAESLGIALETGSGVYHSRKRGVWIKGETSGARQKLLRVDADCDRDALRFTVSQSGPGFCHLSQDTCWGNKTGISALARIIANRLDDETSGSYTRRLANDPALLSAKILEEARELVDAGEAGHVVDEASDLVYFTLVKLATSGCSWSEVAAELDRRQLKVTRRPGDAKPATRE